mgnify:CR=1 FL=1
MSSRDMRRNAAIGLILSIAAVVMNSVLLAYLIWFA